MQINFCPWQVLLLNPFSGTLKQILAIHKNLILIATICSVLSWVQSSIHLQELAGTDIGNFKMALPIHATHIHPVTAAST